MTTLSTFRMLSVLWTQAVLHRRSQGSLWLTWVLVGLLLLLSLAPISARNPRLLVLPALALACLVILWGVVFVGFCRTQFWQTSAGLVPGLRAGIRRIMLTLSFTVPLLAGATFGAAVGYPLLATSCMLFAVAFNTGWVWIAVIVLSYAIPKDAYPLLLAPSAQGALLAVALWLWWARMRMKYPASDTAITATRTPPTQQETLAAIANSGVIALLSRWSVRLDAKTLRNDVRLGRRLAIHGIGQAGHWSAVIPSLVLPGLVVALLVVFTDVRMEDPYLLGGQLLLIPAMWLLGFAKSQEMIKRLADTVVEQGVLRLAPRIQSGTALTRVIVGAMWKRWLAWWMASTAGVMIALGAGFDSLERALCTVALLSTSLVMSALLVRDFTKTFKPMELGSRSFIGLLLLTWALLAAFLAVRLYVAPMSWAWMILLNVAAAAILLRARWRTLAHAPQIFPVARFA